MSIPGPWVETGATVDTENSLLSGSGEGMEMGSGPFEAEVTEFSNIWPRLGATASPSCGHLGIEADSAPTRTGWSNGGVHAWNVDLSTLALDPFEEQDQPAVPNSFNETNPVPRKVHWIFTAGDLAEIARGVSRNMAPRFSVAEDDAFGVSWGWEADDTGADGGLTWDYYLIDSVDAGDDTGYIVTEDSAVATAGGHAYGGVRKSPNFDAYFAAVDAGVLQLSLDAAGTPDSWTYPADSPSTVNIGARPSTLTGSVAPALAFPSWSLKSHWPGSTATQIRVYRTGLIQYFVPDGTPGYPPFTEAGPPYSVVDVPELNVALRYHPLDYRRVYTALPLAVTGLGNPADNTTMLSRPLTLTIEPPWVGHDVMSSVTYRIEWGDGETIDATRQLEHVHAYLGAGSYEIRVTASDSDDNTIVSTYDLTVVFAMTGRPVDAGFRIDSA